MTKSVEGWLVDNGWKCLETDMWHDPKSNVDLIFLDAVRVQFARERYQDEGVALKAMAAKPTIAVPVETLRAIWEELDAALEPMVPYKMDPLEFSNEAHRVKNEHIRKARGLLPKNEILRGGGHV